MGNQTIQERLLQIAHDIMSDVKEAGDDADGLTYTARRALRRLRLTLGEKNPDTEALQALADRARIKDVHDLAAVLDETQLVIAG